MILLLWLVLFLVGCLAQGLFLAAICGAAAGETVKRPDGTDKDSEMILYPFKKWLNKEEENKIFYQGKELAAAYKAWKKKYSSIFPAHKLLENGILFVGSNDLKETHSQLENVKRFLDILEDEQGVNSVVEVAGGELIASFYLLMKQYVRSKWVRKPVLGCPKCMASYWSLITYWIPVLLIFGFDWWEVIVWGPNVVVVSYFAYWLYKKIE
jgi:hypothetical protein